MRNNVLYIPIEIYAREFTSRLLLSSIAAENGFSVYFGTITSCFNILKKIKRGIFIDKCLATSHYFLHKTIKNYGAYLASIDEEGLSSENNSELYLNFRISKQSVQKADLIFCWGDKERSLILNKFPTSDKKVFAVGNPRIDLARFYKNDFNKNNSYILLISNFSQINANGIGFGKNQLSNYNYINKKNISEINSRNNLRWLTFFETAKLFNTLISSFPNQNFIVRPHPSENMTFWKDFLGGFANCTVEFNHDYEKVISNAKIIVHSSCTTGVFSSFKGLRTLAYVPIKEDPYSNFVSNRVSTLIATNITDAMKKFDDLLELKEDDIIKHNKSLLAKERDNVFWEENQLSSSLIVKKLIQFQNENSLKFKAHRKIPFYQALKHMIKFRALKLFPLDKNIKYSKEYSYQTFSELKLESINSTIESFYRQGLIKKIPKITKLGNNLFNIKCF